MACKKARERMRAAAMAEEGMPARVEAQPEQATYRRVDVAAEQPAAQDTEMPERLMFGVDSHTPSNIILQNNLPEFDWVTRNKLYPNFWGRYLTGEDCLTREEIDYLHSKACRVAAIYTAQGTKETEEEGKADAQQAVVRAFELDIPEGTAIFLEIGENEYAAMEYMHGYAQEVLEAGYTPGFKANTDARFEFDREYSRGVQNHREEFSRCLVWAVSPSLAEYDRVTTTHFIHPDNWTPYAPSGMTRGDIAIWQYGKECHPIQDDGGKEATFNVDLVRDIQVIISRMF